MLHQNKPVKNCLKLWFLSLLIACVILSFLMLCAFKTHISLQGTTQATLDDQRIKPQILPLSGQNISLQA